MTSTPVFFSSTCKHTSRTKDYETDTIVCTNCALVMVDGWAEADPEKTSYKTKIEMATKSSFYNYERRWLYQKENVRISKLVDLDNIKDICCTLRISEEYSQEILNHACKLSGIGETSSKTPPPHILAFSIYVICGKKQWYRTMDEVCAAVDCDRKKLWKLQKQHEVGTKDIEEHLLHVEKYCRMVSSDMPYKDVLEVKKLVERLMKQSESKPGTIIGACIMYILERSNKKFQRTDLEMFSKMLGASQSTIARFKKRKLENGRVKKAF